MNTGELARKAGLNKETIRFYEKKGLLPEPRRSSGGYRQFSQDDLERILFIKNAKGLGFSLTEIGELLSIADGEIIDCLEVRSIAEKKLDFVESRIKGLMELKKALFELINQCRKSSKITYCPIIESLSKEVRNDED